MKYVLDSSVALKWVLPEADSGKAIRLRDGYSNGTHDLLAPDIFPIGNRQRPCLCRTSEPDPAR